MLLLRFKSKATKYETAVSQWDSVEVLFVEGIYKVGLVPSVKPGHSGSS